MNFDDMHDYVRVTDQTAVYPGANDELTGPVEPVNSISYITLGLNGEAGEVADLIKKQMRRGGDLDDPVLVEQLVLELGDVLWYIARFCSAYGFSFEDLVMANVTKLKARKEANELKEHE